MRYVSAQRPLQLGGVLRGQQTFEHIAHNDDRGAGQLLTHDGVVQVLQFAHRMGRWGLRQ